MNHTPFTLPAGNPHVRRVSSFEELVNTPFSGQVNALCWQRSLPGDYGEIVDLLATSEDITSLDEELLRALPVSPAGRAAIEQMLQDHALLRDHGLQPSLDCIRHYPREEEPGIVPIDVYSYHADSATTTADTYLCTYHGPTSEGLRNDEVRRCVDIPEVRAALLKRYGGPEGDGFLEFLHDHCYDLHYEALPGVQPFAFGQGNLWRIAIECPDSPVLPCIHRAPENSPGLPPRLLLIS